jgi:hypothetical protein
MSKVIPISKDSLKLKKEKLIIQRLDAIQSCNYSLANKLLVEIQKLNTEIYGV